MKFFFGFMFALFFLTSCQISTSKTINTASSEQEKTKANVTFSGGAKTGICLDCNQ